MPNGKKSVAKPGNKQGGNQKSSVSILGIMKTKTGFASVTKVHDHRLNPEDRGDPQLYCTVEAEKQKKVWVNISQMSDECFDNCVKAHFGSKDSPIYKQWMFPPLHAANKELLQAYEKYMCAAYGYPDPPEDPRVREHWSIGERELSHQKYPGECSNSREADALVEARHRQKVEDEKAKAKEKDDQAWVTVGPKRRKKH